MSGMGQMASSLAHEINQPLTAVSSLLQAARRMLDAKDAAATARARDAVERAAQQMVRAGEIIRRLREFASRGDTEKVEVSVDMMVNEALALARISNKFGATTVHCQIHDVPRSSSTRSRFSRSFSISCEIVSRPWRESPNPLSRCRRVRLTI
jgi:two-component system sensor kinase FixL